MPDATEGTHARPGRRPRVPKPAAAPVALGSISQGDDQLVPGGVRCAACAGSALTQLRMVLGDGTPVVFVSCHQCEQKSWLAFDELGRLHALTREDVLARSTKK